MLTCLERRERGLVALFKELLQQDLVISTNNLFLFDAAKFLPFACIIVCPLSAQKLKINEQNNIMQSNIYTLYSLRPKIMYKDPNF